MGKIYISVLFIKMIKGKGGHNKEQNSSDQCMKVLNKNSLKIKKKNNDKSIHLNPEALFNDRKSEHPEVTKKKKKKFKSNKPKKSQITTKVQETASRGNKLIEMKNSPNNLSSNRKDFYNGKTIHLNPEALFNDRKS